MLARRLPRHARTFVAMVVVLVMISATSAAAEDGAGPVNTDPVNTGPVNTDPVNTDPVNTVPPSLSGESRWNGTLVADVGTWDPAGTPLVVQWLRGGVPVPGESATSYLLDDARDLSQVFSVRVHPLGRPDLAVDSAATVPVARGVMQNTRPPSISGTLRYRHTLKANPGTWSISAPTLRYQWFSGGRAVAGSTSQKYTLRASDVGHTVTVEVTASRTGFEPLQVASAPTGEVQHASRLRKTVTYSVTTRGTVTQSVSTFETLAQETFDDPRGWRANGIAFKRVSKGGDFTLVLSQASKVPTFSSGCSSAWSCRVGRNVIINQNRWRSATSSWNKAGGSLRDYRNMVVNHEVGHWLGKNHATCSGRGRLAPVMMQQSKGLKGCTFNPWPKTSELYSPRYHF